MDNVCLGSADVRLRSTHSRASVAETIFQMLYRSIKKFCCSAVTKQNSQYGSLSLLMLATLLFSGCAHKTGHNDYPLIVDRRELNFLKDRIRHYRENPGEVTAATRNDLVERLIGVSDDHYIVLRNKLLGGRNTVAFLGEVTSTTISAVSALIGDADTKSILSTASSLTQSTNVSIDKNFFKNASTEAIVAKMDQLRADQRRLILTNEGKPGLDAYSLDAALNDVRQYDDAGTIQKAILAIGADTAKHKNDSETATQTALTAR
jgi:hypothetical protein